MALPHTHCRTLFVTQDGAPMRFYVRPGPDKRKLAPLITHGGGEVCRIQEPGVFLLADPTEGHLGPGYISTTYVTDCVRRNRNLSPRAYRLLTPWGLRIKAGKSRSSAELIAIHGAPGRTEEHKGKPAVDMTNNEEAAVQGNRETCTSTVTTTEEATGEREDNVEQMRNIPETVFGDMEGHKGSSAVDLTNNKEVTVQGSRETCTSTLITTEKANGEREDNMEQIRNLIPETVFGDMEGHRGSSTVDLANNKEVTVQGNRVTCTSTVITTEKANGEREDNLEKMGITSPKRTLEEEEDRSNKSPASRSGIPTEADAESGKELKTVSCATSSRNGTCIEAATGDERDDKNTGGIAAAHSTSSGPRDKPPSLRKMDVEQTLNEDNYSTLAIPDPRTSTPAPGNSNTVKDLESDTAHNHDLMKDGESPLGAHFRRPRRKVADKTKLSDGENHYSPNMKQKRVEKQTDIHKKLMDESQMSFLHRHCGQALQESPIGEAQISELGSHGTQEQTTTEESHSAVSPAGDMRHIAEAETGTQKYTTKELDRQNAESHRVQMVIPLQGHRASVALRHGRMAFTKEEDMAILLYIRDNVSSSLKVTGTVLWKDMEKKKVLRRTWQAMKTRYVKYLVNQKKKYKLPPKCPSLLTKDSSSERMQGSPKTNRSWLNCASNSTVTSQKCDTTIPSTSANIPHNCDTTQPSVSTDIPQNCNTTLPSASADIPQNCDPAQASASADIPQNCCTTQASASADISLNCGTTQPSASADNPQNCDIAQPSASVVGIQKWDSMLPSASTDTPQKVDPNPPTASVVSPQKCDTMIPSASADTPKKVDILLPSDSSGLPQKGDTTLPSTSADTHQSCIKTKHGAFTSANALVTNIASKQRSILTPRKRSSDPANESSPHEKGNKMFPSPHSAKTVLLDREDSGDSDDLHIFDRANMEFEETDDNTVPEQPASAFTQTEDNNNSASHVDETPPTLQASESEGLREALIDMMREFKLDVSHVTQALYFNNGELGSTRHFLRTGARPDGYPIWEPKDDLDVKNDNPKMQSHLIKKYGADNVARRVAFLAT